MKSLKIAFVLWRPAPRFPVGRARFSPSPLPAQFTVLEVREVIRVEYAWNGARELWLRLDGAPRRVLKDHEGFLWQCATTGPHPGLYGAVVPDDRVYAVGDVFVLGAPGVPTQHTILRVQ